MKTATMVAALIGGASILTVMLAGCGCYCDLPKQPEVQKDARLDKNKDQQNSQVDNKDSDNAENKNGGARIDPLGKFTSPGRCIGSMCM